MKPSRTGRRLPQTLAAELLATDSPGAGRPSRSGPEQREPTQRERSPGERSLGERSLGEPCQGLMSRDELLQAGLDAHRANRFSEARRFYEAALGENPADHRALQLLGVACHQMGDHLEAEARIRAAIAIADDVAEYHANLGGVLLNLQRNQEAWESLSRAQRLAPDQFATLFNLSEASRRTGDLECAEQLLRRACQLWPDSQEAWNQLGLVLVARNRFEEAEGCFAEVLTRNPYHADALNNYGIIRQSKGEVREALAYYDRAIRARPGFAEAYNQKAMAYRDLQDGAMALACYRTALRLKPDLNAARSAYIYLLNYDTTVSRQTLFDEHRKWAAVCASVAPFPPPDNLRDPDRPLRVGYVSPDFRAHPVARYMEPILQLHDRGLFHVACYAEVARPDSVTERLRTLVPEWRTTCGLTDEALARMIRADQIDILVDLAGHTANSRLRAFAYRPAPVQISYLGYPGTTGLSAIDYYLSDPILTPQDDQRYFTEQLVRLPRVCCYVPPENAGPVEPSPWRDRGWLTFGSLHRPEKLTPRTLQLWARVLREVPESRLLIFWSTLRDETRRRLQSFFVDRGISLDRIQVRNESPPGGYLEVYNEIDIGLDVVPWNGATTTLEALWMGVAVLGLRGDRMLSRGTESILEHLELGTFVANDDEEYAVSARRLAESPEILSSLRSQLREKLRATFCDGLGFIQSLERTYRDLWRRHC